MCKKTNNDSVIFIGFLNYANKAKIASLMRANEIKDTLDSSSFLDQFTRSATRKTDTYRLPGLNVEYRHQSLLAHKILPDNPRLQYSNP